jgi:hypothetical protein
VIKKYWRMAVSFHLKVKFYPLPRRLSHQSDGRGVQGEGEMGAVVLFI